MGALVSNLDIMILRVEDIEAARIFYGKTLGLDLVGEGPGFFSVTPVNGVGATLGVGLGRDANEPQPGQTGLWWKVADVDGLYAALVAKDVRITAAPADMPFGRAVSFADPSGNILNAYSDPRA